VDNVTVAPGGEMLDREDSADDQIVAVTADGAQVSLLQILDFGEAAGPAAVLRGGAGVSRCPPASA